MRIGELIDRLNEIQQDLEEARGLIQKAGDLCDNLDSTELGDVLDKAADAAGFCTDADCAAYHGSDQLRSMIRELEEAPEYLPRHAKED